MGQWVLTLTNQIEHQLRVATKEFVLSLREMLSKDDVIIDNRLVGLDLLS
jgi:hypothetical protein